MVQMKELIRNLFLGERSKEIKELVQDITQRISVIEEFDFKMGLSQLFRDKLPTLTKTYSQIGEETIGKIVVKRRGGSIHIILNSAFLKDHVGLTFNEDKSNNVTGYFSRITPHSNEPRLEVKLTKDELSRLRIIQEAIRFVEEMQELRNVNGKRA